MQSGRFLDKILLLIICFSSLFIDDLSFGNEGMIMGLEVTDTRKTDTSKIAKRISLVENGLIPAIRIQGLPLERKNIVDQMKEMKVPAVSIAVINDGKIEWAKAYGVLSCGAHQKANATTRFQAGSISKPVAAFAILTLVDKGLIELDEDVNLKLLSWKVPENAYTKDNKVTPRNVLSHSSGLSVIGFDGYKKGELIPTLTQALDGLLPSNHPPVRVEFPPSSKMSYSGGGYLVAQQLVEDVINLPFIKFIDDALLKPLKMNQSTFGFLDFNHASNVAYAHPANGVPMAGGWKNYPESAAAGLWTTPTDLAKWLIEIQNKLSSEDHAPILNKKLLDAFITPQVGVHGLGPVVNGQGIHLELSHKGRTDGFTCGFVSFPKLQKGAVVMTNAGNDAAFVDDVLRSIACEYEWPSYSIKTKTPMELTEEALEKYVGRYGWGDKPNEMYDLLVFREKNELRLKIGNASNAHRLYSEALHQFFLIDTGYEVIFQEDCGSVKGLTIVVQQGFEREFKKFQDKSGRDGNNF